MPGNSLGINKLQTPHENRHDETFRKAASQVFNYNHYYSLKVDYMVVKLGD